MIVIIPYHLLRNQLMHGIIYFNSTLSDFNVKIFLLMPELIEESYQTKAIEK